MVSVENRYSWYPFSEGKIPYHKFFCPDRIWDNLGKGELLETLKRPAMKW